jgi:hypothetical protein
MKNFHQQKLVQIWEKAVALYEAGRWFGCLYFFNAF